MNYNNDKINIITTIKKNYFLIVIAIITIALLIIFGLEQNNNINKSQGDVVNEFYSSTLKPFFTSESIDKKDVLNFAFKGDLHLDKSGNKVLQLGTDSVGREILGISKLDKIEETDSYAMVVEKLKLEEGKRKEKLDSILDFYSKELSKSIYKDENRVVAVDPQIGIIRKLLNKDLIGLFENISQDDKSLNKVLKNRDAKSIHEFIVFTPDTIYNREYKYTVNPSYNPSDTDKVFSLVENKGSKKFPFITEGENFYFRMDSNSMSVTFNDLEEIDELRNASYLKILIDSTNDKMNFSFEVFGDSSDNVKLKFSFPDSIKNKMQSEMSSEEIGKVIKKSMKVFSGKDVEDWMEFGNKMDSISQKINSEIEKEK